MTDVHCPKSGSAEPTPWLLPLIQQFADDAHSGSISISLFNSVDTHRPTHVQTRDRAESKITKAGGDFLARALLDDKLLSAPPIDDEPDSKQTKLGDESLHIMHVESSGRVGPLQAKSDQLRVVEQERKVGIVSDKIQDPVTKDDERDHDARTAIFGNEKGDDSCQD